MTPNKRKREQALDQIEEQLTNAQSGGEWSVEWRSAAPDKRPEGMAVDTDARTIYYDAWEAQADTLEALGLGDSDVRDADIVAFLAGYGSGKTVTGARWLITQALRHPGSRFLAIGVSYSEARNSTYRTLFDALPGERTTTRTSSFNGPESSPVVADYNRSENRLTFVNDAEIILGSADKWNRVAGAEYGAIWMDEPSHYALDLHDLLEMAGGRFRGVAGPHVQFWSLTGAGFGDAWRILEQRETADGDPLPHNIDVIRASTLNNPYLDAGARERYERQYGGTGREEQALHGGFTAAQGRVYPAFSRETHIIDPADAREIVKPQWRAYGYDAGHRDPRVLLEGSVS